MRTGHTLGVPGPGGGRLLHPGNRVLFHPRASGAPSWGAPKPALVEARNGQSPWRLPHPEPLAPYPQQRGKLEAGAGGGQKDLQSQAGSWGYKAVRMSTLECGALSILSGRGLPLTQSYGSTAVRRGVPSPGQETNNSTPSRHLISLIPAAGSPGAASSRLHIPLRRTFHGGGK